MTTAYTSLLGLALPVTGELSGTWGDVVNNSITSLLDSAVAGTTNVSTDGDVTLTTTTGAANTAREAILLFSGARTALRTVTAPAQSKIYTVINATTGGYSVKLVGSGPTTGLTIPNGASAVVAWNGSDFVEVGTSSIGNLTVNGNLTVTGATTLQSTLAVTGNITNTAGTANGVTYLNGSKVLTSGSALTFDGSSLSNTRASGTFATGSFITSIGSVSGVFSGDSSLGAVSIGSYSNHPVAFYQNNSEQMRLTSTGLGIGTSSPATKLHVYSTSARPITAGNASATWTFGPTGSSFAFRENSSGSDFLTLDSSGNVGVGTTSASSFGKFAVSGTASPIAQISSLSSSGYNSPYTSAVYIGGTNTDNVDNGVVVGYRLKSYGANASTGAVFTIETANKASGSSSPPDTFTERVRLTSSGNLLVGSTSAFNGELLQVSRAGTVSTTDFIYGSAPTALIQTPNNGADNKAVLMLRAAYTDGSFSAGSLSVKSATQYRAEMVLTYDADISGGYFAINQFIPTSASTSERARFDSNGIFLIGRTSSSGLGQIQVAGGADLATDSGAVYLARGSGGTVSITGTSSYAKTTINAASLGNNAMLSFSTPDGTYNPRVIISHVTSSSRQYTNFSSSYSSGTGLSDWVFDSGNVGIGITAPAQQLDVRGSSGATIRVGSSGNGGSGDEFGNLEFYWADPDAAETKCRIYAKNTGNVGPGGGATADLLFATRPVFGSLTERARIDSDGNFLVGTTSTSGSTSNDKYVLGGLFRTASASVSTSNGTATTVITLPASIGTYLASVWIIADDAVNYSATSLLSAQANNAAVVNTVLRAGNLLTITMSGYNVRVTQSSGGTATVNCSILRIA